jgi:uncharacterized Zn-binding protein involved in type VI secretion
MPAVARSAGNDRVLSRTGTGYLCGSPMQTVTGTGSPNVFVNNIAVVRQSDVVGVHPAAGCSTDTSTLSTYSSTVFVNGLGIGRIGDEYTSDNIIISGSTNVFAG